MTTKPKMYYPYNESFDHYASPMPKDQAEAFVAEHNRYKGGHWVVGTSDLSYRQWLQREEYKHDPNVMTLQQVLQILVESLNEVDGDYVAHVWNRMRTQKIEYIGDSLFRLEN